MNLLCLTLTINKPKKKESSFNFIRLHPKPHIEPLVTPPATPTISEFSIGYNGYRYSYTRVGNPTLVEDAHAVLNGAADYLLGDDEVLVDVDGIHGIDQGLANAVASSALDISVALQTDSGNTPDIFLPQLRTQVPVAPFIPLNNNEVLHATATAPLQCPQGCAGTFRRREEYRRHMKKHNGPFFPCTHPHCSKMFYRQDKLRDHFNKGH
ncbi:hypothetical protein BKA58DRAFT_458586 [Alternaria rosae]|uniref:uncharacterized protein n=1 Tax=Alternaria rosae TaxID=1187941 RepID=UPI001E8EC173|nr:uncharacterized protein BKA58DRAFT_458586 [Alternaria rosae]KAH6867982.1 hypothetical protein BKA58DRAFT_458586 [Alternaria rosae]